MPAANELNLNDEQLKALGDRLTDLIEASEAERGKYHAAWKQNQDYYDNINSQDGNNFIPGMQMQHFPLLQPRVDALRDNVIGTITANDPVMLGRLRGSSRRLESVENTLQFFLDLGQFNDALLELAVIAAITNAAIIRTSFEAVEDEFLAGQPQGIQRAKSGPLSFVGLRWDVIHPQDFVIYPYCATIETATIVGHWFSRSRREIAEFQLVGRYLSDLNLNPAEDKEEIGWSYSKLSANETSNPADQQIDLYEVVFKCDLTKLGEQEEVNVKAKKLEKYYRATVAPATRTVLAVHPHLPSRPNYSVARFKPPRYNQFWSTQSVAQDLQGLQWQYNHLQNLAVYGSYMAAFPPIVTDGAFEKQQKYGPGRLISASGNTTTPMATRFDPGMIEGMITQIERQADASVRISQNATAQEFKADRTATETAQIAAAQQVGISGFIAIFGQALVDVADIASELLFLNKDVWVEFHGDQTAYGSPNPESTPEDFLEPIRWEIAVQTPEMLPQQTFQKMQLLLELANADQQVNAEAILQAAMQYIPQEFLPQFQAEVQAAGKPMLNREEIMRTLVKSMRLPNDTKILNEDTDDGLGQLLQQPGMEGGQTPPFGAQELGFTQPDLQGPGGPAELGYSGPDTAA